MSDSCCHSDDGHDHGHDHKQTGIDIIYHGSLAVIVLAIAGYFALPDFALAHDFGQAVMELLKTMWWGMALGIVFVGLMSKMPREYVQAALGRGDTLSGIVRATVAGLFLDLCSHGILMVGAKLYERGASLGQVMAFMIASPWNSFSLTIILFALIGLKWTLIFIAGSALIAIVTGVVFQACIKAGTLPDNPNSIDMPKNFSLKDDMRACLKDWKPNRAFFKDIAKAGWAESRMLLRWLLLGLIIAAAIRAFVSVDMLTHWFGPSIFGLFMTLIATTIIEVCSEGSSPIAAEIVNRAGAPGNGFTFLMAGVSTDYTEMMIIREFSKSWKITLFLPLITVPQILLLGYIMNVMG